MGAIFSYLPRQRILQLGQDPVLSDISDLPNDVLVEIFCALRSITISSAHNPDSPSDDRYWSTGVARFAASWLTVAQVCVRWRNVALHTPRLWSTFSLSNAAHANAMLERSKCAPLSVFCDLTLLQDNVEASSVISSTSQQLQALRIRTRGVELDHMARSLPSLPGLQKLMICQPQRPHSPSQDFVRVYWPDMPDLRRLELLYSIPPTIVFPTMSNLVQLKALSVTMSLAWFFKIMKDAAPHLRDIRATVSRQQTGPNSYMLDLAHLHLPQLQKLRLHTFPEEAATIFHRINLPARTDTLIYLPEPVGNLASLVGFPVIHNLAPRWVGLDQSWQKFALTIFVATEGRCFEMLLVPTTTPSFSDLPRKDCKFFRLHFGCGTPANFHPQGVELCRPLPLTKVAYLCLKFNSLAHTTFRALDIIRLFSRLEDLVCDSCTSLDFLDALLPEGNLQVPPNPFIETMKIVLPMTQIGGLPNIDYTRLIAVLDQRNHLGFPISFVTIKALRRDLPPSTMFDGLYPDTHVILSAIDVVV